MQFVTTIAVVGLFAAVGSLASAYEVERGFDLVGWVVRSGAVLAVAVLVLGGAASGRRSRLVSVVLVALFLPYAVESVSQSVRGDLALIAMVISVALVRSGGVARLVAAGIAAGVACQYEAIAFVWPIAHALASVSRRESRVAEIFMFVCGVVGIAFGLAYRWSGDLGSGNDAGLAAVHRDLAILLPLLLLGAVGYAKARSGGFEIGKGCLVMLPWTAVALGCLFLVVLGVPLDVRLCALPLFWWMPIAVAELGAITFGAQRANASLRAVGFLSLVVVGCLLIPGVMRLLDGPLIAVFLLG